MLGVQLVPERCACEKGCCERRDGGGGVVEGARGLVSVCLSIIYQIYCFLCLIAGCHRPSPGPPAPSKPRSHPCRKLTSIKLCCTNAIKSPQLRVGR